MQLTQKYTINNISYTNELFIKDESTNVNIKEIMQHFFNSVQPVFNYSCSCHSKQSGVTNINTINNNESKEASKPASEESSTPVTLTSVFCEDYFSRQNQEESEKVARPASEESKTQEEQTGWRIKDCYIHKTNPSGFYIKFKVGNNIIEKWSRADSENNAKAGIYNYISKLRKERNDTVDYEILEIKAMTLEEYNNRKSEKYHGK